MIVLVDSSSMHNFISKKIIKLLQSPVAPDKLFDIKIANRRPLKCKEKFENVQVLI